MGLGVLSIKYQTETRGAVDLPILQACIGEKVKIIVELYYDQIYIADNSVGKKIYYAPTPSVSGKFYNDDLIWFEDGAFLNSCQVGDIFMVADPAGYITPGPYTLLEILSGGLGRFDATFPPTQEGDVPGQVFYSVTPLKSLMYQFGINEYGNYMSPVDDSLQKFSIDSAGALTDVVSQLLDASGNKDWQIDSVTLVGLGDDSNYPTDARVQIKITHESVVTPLFLAGQYDDLLNGIAPDYFKPDNLIRYQSQIDWNKSNANLDPAKQLIIDSTGQFGWFGTRYNGAASDYTISSLTIKRVSDAEFVDQLEYNEMEVKFRIASAAGAFDPADTALVFGFNFLPDDTAFYQNTNRLMSENFCFDSKRFLPDNTPVNGNNFGTAKQVIKTINGEVLDANTVEVTARILFGADQVAILQQGDVAQYAMWVITENTDLDVVICDKSNMLVQVNEIYVQLTKVDLLDDETKFIEHPYDVVAHGKDTLEMFPVDDVAVNSKFALDYTGLEGDGIVLKACTPALVLTHATEADITLDSFRINLDNYPTIGTLPVVQAIDFNQLRPYKIENGIRKYIAFERDFNLDTPDVKFFILNFPFMNRWEYWIRIARLSSIPLSLFDPAVPFNGGNHLWDRLANTAGWSLVYRTRFEIVQNGKLFEQEFEHELTSTYFESNPEWTECSIKTYDIDTNDEIVVGPKKYANAKKDTKVICSFKKSTGDVPELDHVAIVIWAEGFEGGGITEITRISSVYDVIDSSLLKSSDASNKVIMTKDDNVFTGEALIKADKIENLSKLTLYARIYVLEDILDDSRVTNDFIVRIVNDGQVRIVLT